MICTNYLCDQHQIVVGKPSFHDQENLNLVRFPGQNGEHIIGGLENLTGIWLNHCLKMFKFLPQIGQKKYFGLKKLA